MKCHGRFGHSSDSRYNLADQQWNHTDGSFQSIYDVIFSGLPEQGMYGWGQKLNHDDLVNLTIYVKSLSDLD